MAPKCAIANLYSSKYYRGKKLKKCQEWPHLLKDNYLPKTTTFEWSQESSSYTGLIVLTWSELFQSRQFDVSLLYWQDNGIIGLPFKTDLFLFTYESNYPLILLFLFFLFLIDWFLLLFCIIYFCIFIFLFFHFHIVLILFIYIYIWMSCECEFMLQREA